VLAIIVIRSLPVMLNCSGAANSITECICQRAVRGAGSADMSDFTDLDVVDTSDADQVVLSGD